MESTSDRLDPMRGIIPQLSCHRSERIRLHCAGFSQDPAADFPALADKAATGRESARAYNFETAMPSFRVCPAGMYPFQAKPAAARQLGHPCDTASAPARSDGGRDVFPL